MTDWLTALDDGLVGRHRACTLCGKKESTAYWGIAAAGDVAVSYVLCQACRAKDRDSQQVEALLERRYGKRDGCWKQ
jgi:hypothetical protein